MKVVIGGSLESVDLAIRRYVDLYGRSHVEKLPVIESRVLDELKEYNQKLESIKLENRKLYISSVKSDNQKQETGRINEIDSNQKQEIAKTEEIDSSQKIETNKTERRKSIVERMKEGEDDPNDFWYNPTHEDLSLKPQDIKIMEGMLAFRDRLAKLSDSTPLDFSDMVCIGDEKPEKNKSDTEGADEGETTRDVDDEEERENDFPNWGDDENETAEDETDDESDFDDGWGEPDSESSEVSDDSEESDEKESEEDAVDDEDDGDTWGSSEDDSEDDMDDSWGSDDSDDSDSTDENTEKEESGESGSYDWNDMGSWDNEDSDDEDEGNEGGEESEGTNETTEDDNYTEVDTYEDDKGSWDLDGWSDDSEDDDTEVQVEKSEDDVKRDLKKVFGISLKTDKKGEKENREEDTKEEKETKRENIEEEKEVKPSREVIKEEKVAKHRREDIGDVDDDFWNDESSEKEVQKPEVIVKKKEVPVSYDTSSLRGFVKSHKGCKCTIEEALQYFKKADIERDLRMGRVFKGKKSLFI